MCMLKNEKRNPVSKIYLSFVAKKELVMFNIKYDYVGYEFMGAEEDSRRRVMSDRNLHSENFSK